LVRKPLINVSVCTETVQEPVSEKDEEAILSHDWYERHGIVVMTSTFISGVKLAEKTLWNDGELVCEC